MSNLISKTILLSLLIIYYQPAFGQLTTSKKSKNKTWIIENKASAKPLRVEIQELKDASVTVLLVDKAMPSILKTYEIREIEKIKFKSKRKLIKNLIIGTAIGTFLGASFGNVIDERSEVSEKEAIYGIGLIGGVVGGAIGFGIGSIKITIPINGQQRIYERKRKKIKKHGHIN